MDIDKNKLYEKAIALWKDAQIIMMIEETSELQEEILKHLENPFENDILNISEEIADFFIMVEQVTLLWGNNSEIVDYKDFYDEKGYRKEVSLFRLNKQLSKFNKEICQFLRKRKTLSDLSKRIAKCSLSVEEIVKMYFLREKVLEFKELKLERLKERIEKHQQKL